MSLEQLFCTQAPPPAAEAAGRRARRRRRPKAPGEHLPEREKNDVRHTAQAAQDGADAPRAKNAWCSLRVNGGADAPQVRNEDA